MTIASRHSERAGALLPEPAFLIGDELVSTRSGGFDLRSATAGGTASTAATV